MSNSTTAHATAQKKSKGHLAFLVASLLALPSFASATESAAGLSWTSLEASVDARNGEDAVELAFPFTNEGAAPIRITKIDTSCSCTTAGTTALLVAPGGTSKITARLQLKGMTGRVRRSLMVYTDRGESPAHLTVEANVVPLVDLSSRLVWWAQGSAPDAKSLKVLVNQPELTRIQRVRSESEAFKAELTPDTKIGVNTLLVTPASTASGAQTRIEIVYEHGGRTSSVFVIAVVK